ncbi:MAG: MBL fold metallo-hydrolase [Clostridia bacterium]|nr:MBL fold metallo-hydrolase [Clostridia bacterium]
MELHRFSLGNMVTNSYILFSEEHRQAVLFDAPAEPEKILKYMEERELTLQYIFLTHAHFDHILALSELKAKTGAKIVLHEKEEQYLNDISLNLSFEELPHVDADVLVKDADVFEFCGTQIKVIHTPGHTVGSVCYYFDDTLISGDTLFLGSIGRFDFPMGSFEDEISSIKEKLMILPDDVKVYPGHGFRTSIGRERKGNPYLL